jgi:hypothetical protein
MLSEDACCGDMVLLPMRALDVVTDYALIQDNLHVPNILIRSPLGTIEFRRLFFPVKSLSAFP